ncbi:hypothetical protein EC957_008293 [Mortierella hygrophila]|uniref:dolichyl-phosphate-mannose--protein mannosyltransferase n=1 Tax=Mortierella hygrophila TaxID=979708 RepID=A0A9P6EXW8_9FUNG|nr:hypothetical protein EC957_008293 [Mortierella hygrophila]
MFSSSGSYSSNSSQTNSRSTSSHSFLDPSGLDFDLPPAQPANPSNHITTIHEDSEEEEADYIHIHPSRRPMASNYSNNSNHANSNGDGHTNEHSSYPYSEKSNGYPPTAGDSAVYGFDQHYPHQHQAYPFADTPPTRSLTSSPSLPASPYYSPGQQPPQQQPPTRYQYPRTRSGPLNGNGSAAGLPLYASRTQRMRNGQSTSLDHSGKPIFRGPQPRISSGGIGGLSSSDSDDDEDFFVGGQGGAGRGGLSKRFSVFKNRRGRPWYKSRELHIVLGICVLSLIVRLWHIGYPTSVVFDEVHFGGFASKYIRGRFFMDVHPPLAKMLIAVTGWIFGLDPSFDFKEIGLDYLAPKVPYVAMRMLCGLMGVAVVPMAFYTIKNSGHSLHASILAAVLVLFENSIVTQSRLILLDSPLIFFTAFTVLAWTNFHNQRKDPFSDDWFLWLFLTGLGLGLAGSVKWVGLFIIATIGTSTINQLWVLWGDLKISPRVWFNHFLARAVCLIAVPLVIYMFMFEIHFLLLANSGDGDGFMSAPFQMTLGKSLQDSPLGVAYGATVSIRHLGTQGGYLHSHPSNYETGSKQQQITLYPHKDTNNDWILQRQDGTVPDKLEYIKSGDIIRLKHVTTFKRLHSHNNKAPVTEDENHFEVSAYGGTDEFPGDSNDEWKLEILDYEGKDKAAGQNLHTLRSIFKLSHPNMACDLFSHSVKLPKWAFEQQEVTCMRSASRTKVTFMIESNAYSSYPANAPMVNYRKPGFIGKFLELNKVMWTTNAGLTASHPYDSRPSSWIWLRRGISFWGKDQKHIYLIGNWFTWYMSSFSIVLYAAIRVLLVVRDKRGYRDNFRGLREYYELSGGFFFMAWCYHYLPFFLMGRQLFLHHYLPALYFAILMLCVTFDLACRFIPIRFRLAALIVVSLMAILVFRTRAPLAYGSEWTRSQCEASKVLKTWDYDCYQYPESYASYRAPKDDSHMFGRIVHPSSAPVPAPAVPVVAGGVGEDPKNDKPHDFLENLFPHAPSPAAAVVPDEVAAVGGSKADSGMENIQLGNHPNHQAGKGHAAAGAVVSPKKQDPVAPVAPAAPSPPGLGSIRHAAAAAARAAAAGAGARAGEVPPPPIIEELVGEGGDDSGAEDIEDVPDVEDGEEEGVLEEGDEGFNDPGAEEEAEAEAVEDEFLDTKSELTAAAAAEAAADKQDDDQEEERRHAL